MTLFQSLSVLLFTASPAVVTDLEPIPQETPQILVTDTDVVPDENAGLRVAEPRL